MQKITCKNRKLQPDRDILGLAAELARLNALGVHELQERFHEVFGFPARSNHKAYLRKRLAFRIQELSLKGLSEQARLRIQELATEPFPEPRRPRSPSPGKKGKPRDQRLPPPGSVLCRNYQEKVHEGKVLGDGFEYEGKHYRTLSKVAREITGMQWNGYLFFHLRPAPEKWRADMNSGDGNGRPRGPGIRCAIYTRKSTSVGLDQEFTSLDAQREACMQYIGGQGRLGWLALAPAYEDGGFTGANLDRPAFQRLLADVEAGRIDVIVTHKVDRLSRSLLDFANIIDYFNRRQVAFVSVTQNFSTADAMGRLTLHMLMSFAEFEREMISERTREKVGAARKKGKWTGGHAPFGYRVVDKKLVVDEREEKFVQRVFDLYLERRSALAVAQSIAEQSLRSETTEHPQKWDKHVVLRMLKNPLYAGYMPYRNELYEGEHAMIINREKFQAVQRLLGDHAGTHRVSTDAYLLQGLTRCATCGAAYSPASAKQGKTKRRYYRCLTRDKQGRDACPARPLPAESLEEFVVGRVRDAAARMANPDELLSAIKQDYAARLKARLSERQRLPGLIGALAGEGTKVVKEIEQATDADRKSLDEPEQQHRVPLRWGLSSFPPALPL